MKRNFALLISLMILLSVAQMPVVAQAPTLRELDFARQQGRAATTNPGTCALPENAQMFPGGRFRRAGEDIYYQCWHVLGREAEPAGVALIPERKRNNTFFLADPLAGGDCSRPGDLHYSVGAVVLFSGSTYRCSTIVDQNLRPSGVAWVEVEGRGGNDFVIKGLP